MKANECPKPLGWAIQRPHRHGHRLGGGRCQPCRAGRAGREIFNMCLARQPKDTGATVVAPRIWRGEPQRPTPVPCALRTPPSRVRGHAAADWNGSASRPQHRQSHRCSGPRAYARELGAFDVGLISGGVDVLELVSNLPALLRCERTAVLELASRGQSAGHHGRRRYPCIDADAHALFVHSARMA